MDRLLEFSMNHPELVGPFFVLLIGFFLLESRRGGKTVSSAQLTNLINNEDALLIDVRDTKEYREGHITGARNIPFSKLKDSLAEIAQFKEKPVVVVCKMGQHAGAAGKILNTDGFKNVLRLKGGIATWSADGLPLVKGKAK
ncbi:rhodanese-like domain-containing protein [Ketobacter sp.]|nr:MAG: rhodanese-like domain-containing protein [Ketobacter sp.]